MEISNNSVFLVEYCGWEDVELLAVYNNEESALAHKYDVSVVKKYGTERVHIREVGVRTNKQLKPIFDRAII